MGWFDKPDVSPDTKSVAERNGNTSTYFGGIGKADGKGHGHVVADKDGKVSYEREAGVGQKGSHYRGSKKK